MIFVIEVGSVWVGGLTRRDVRNCMATRNNSSSDHSRCTIRKPGVRKQNMMVGESIARSAHAEGHQSIPFSAIQLDRSHESRLLL